MKDPACTFNHPVCRDRDGQPIRRDQACWHQARRDTLYDPPWRCVCGRHVRGNAGARAAHQRTCPQWLRMDARVAWQIACIFAALFARTPNGPLARAVTRNTSRCLRLERDADQVELRRGVA